MSLLTSLAYVLASFNCLFFGTLGGWFYVHHEFPAAMVDDMKSTVAGTAIFEQMWNGPELSQWALAGSYLMYAAMIPAIATAPRWARFPPTVLMAVHTLYAMTYHEARLIAPIPYPTVNIIIHAIISLGFLLLLTLPEPHHSGSSNNNKKSKPE